MEEAPLKLMQAQGRLMQTHEQRLRSVLTPQQAARMGKIPGLFGGQGPGPGGPGFGGPGMAGPGSPGFGPQGPCQGGPGGGGGFGRRTGGLGGGVPRLQPGPGAQTAAGMLQIPRLCK